MGSELRVKCSECGCYTGEQKEGCTCRCHPKPTATVLGDLWLPTYSGQRVNLTNPDPATISLMDLAQSLSKIPRYLGHTIRPLSVAEHCVRLALCCEGEDRGAALLHDGAEAYLADIPSTYKRSAIMGNYLRIEAGLTAAIFKRFGVHESPEVSRLDKVIRLAEWDCGLFKVPESLIGYHSKTPDQIRECKTLQRAMKAYRHLDRWGWHHSEALEHFLATASLVGIKE